MNNLVTSFRHSNTLPIYFRIHESDLPALSQTIEMQFATSDHNNTYRYFFLYFKFGQMNISMQFLVLSLDKITTFLHILPTHFFNKIYSHLRMTCRISLRDLASSTHPLLTQGNFSLFNDRYVSETDDVSFTPDMDGICLLSR